VIAQGNGQLTHWGGSLAFLPAFPGDGSARTMLDFSRARGVLAPPAPRGRCLTLPLARRPFDLDNLGFATFAWGVGMMVRNDAELARLLDIDRSAVSRAKARGMPTSSLEEAMAWREQNMSIAYRKDTNPVRASAQPSRRRQGDGPLAVVAKLLVDAESALKSGVIDAIEEDLRLALRAVPAERRGDVLLGGAVIDALCEYALGESACPGRGSFADMCSDCGVSRVGLDRVTYRIAAMEPIPIEWLRVRADFYSMIARLSRAGCELLDQPPYFSEEDY
jgi:hypothetical protein